ncbi:hypothetical protein CR513_27637, partial [Mucuna pruriens]
MYRKIQHFCYLTNLQKKQIQQGHLWTLSSLMDGDLVNEQEFEWLFVAPIIEQRNAFNERVSMCTTIMTSNDVFVGANVEVTERTEHPQHLNRNHHHDPNYLDPHLHCFRTMPLGAEGTNLLGCFKYPRPLSVGLVLRPKSRRGVGEDRSLDSEFLPRLRCLPYKREIRNCIRHTTKFNIFCPFNLVSEQSKAVPVPITEARRLGCCHRHLSPPAATRRLLPPLVATTAHCRCLPLFATVVLFVGLVPTIMKGDGIAVENTAMVASHRGRSGRGTRGMSRNGKGGRGKLICSHCGKEGHLQNRCYDLIGWPNKTANISSSDIPSNERTGFQLILDEEYQEFLRLKSNNHTQSSVSPSMSNCRPVNSPMDPNMKLM